MKTVKELENILNDPSTSEQDYREADAELFDKVVGETIIAKNDSEYIDALFTSSAVYSRREFNQHVIDVLYGDEKTYDPYTIAKALGIPMACHCSDLYLKFTEESKKIVENYAFRCNVSTFISGRDNTLWYSIPFAYNPYWERRKLW